MKIHGNQLAQQLRAEWDELTRRMAYWVDLEHPYVTYSNDYIETIWHILKLMWDRDLIYQGHKILPYCPRCGTSLSSHEVALQHSSMSLSHHCLLPLTMSQR